ncbi:MAG: hypothetical protein IK103_08970 [Bacteroidales bacterium]|nr:hypothetical protein [Bacteroidales bacterium]
MEKRFERFLNLSGSEFLDFLYNERDRERSYDSFHGWNNWVLIGAIVTISCWLYRLLVVYHSSLDNYIFLCFLSALMAFGLGLGPWLILFRQSRGIDYSRMRKRIDVFPVFYYSFLLLCALILIICFLVYDAKCGISVLWSIVFLFHGLFLLLALVFKEDIVPAYYVGNAHPSEKWNIFVCIVSPILLSLTGWYSAFMGKGSFFSHEFEAAICMVSIAFLIYVLIKVNLHSRASLRIDKIIDNYIYCGFSEEATIRAVFINRVGYGVLDVCEEELQSLEVLLAQYDVQTRDMETSYESLKGGAEIGNIQLFRNKANVTIQYLETLLKRVGKLNNKLSKILVQAEKLNINQDFCNLTRDVIDKTSLAISRVQEFVVRISVMISEIKSERAQGKYERDGLI